jgi:hypothetical protein
VLDLPNHPKGPLSHLGDLLILVRHPGHHHLTTPRLPRSRHKFRILS